MFAFQKSSDKVLIDNEWFKDELGRTIIFRGTNLTAKNPSFPRLASHQRKDFFNHRAVSFVGKPFCLESADDHFSRLKFLGLTLLRLGVNWEAVEHRGPGLYDEEYLNYLLLFVQKAEQHGLHIFIDFHQDVWSRFTGGDGAPGWTLEMVGFNMENFEATGAAILHDIEANSHHLLWPTNAYKLGAATMFTLFFGGKTFTPHFELEGVNVEEFLQRKYIDMVGTVAERLKGCQNVIGFDVMNEPIRGYIGCKHLNKVFGLVQFGDTPTPLESMALGDGMSLEVGVWKKKRFLLKKSGTRVLNVEHKRAWHHSHPCIFRAHGVWDVNANGLPILLKPDYFAKIQGKDVDFENQFYKPFLLKVKKRIHDIDENAMCFIENVVGAKPPTFEKSETKNVVFTGHWYDAFVLVMKRFFSCIGFDMFRMKGVIALPRWIRKSFASQISLYKHFAYEKFGNVPTLISEFGIPIDLNKKKAYLTGDFWQQNRALNRSFIALDDNLISATIWNYTPSNTNLFGDEWNAEDLSIFSNDQHFDPRDPYSGIRAKEALVRPYAKKTAGTPLYMHFDMDRGVFEYIFRQDKTISYPTEIFLPDLHFKQGFIAQVSDGSYQYIEEKQLFLYTPSKEEETPMIRIRKKN